MSSAPVDFLRPQRAPWLGWVLLIAGVGSVAATLWLDQQWSAERAQREAAQRAREAAVLQARRAASRLMLPTADQRGLERIAPQLRQPWLPTLRLIENATEAPVFLLGLSIDPATGWVRLDAEAPTFDHALAYTQLLDEAGLLGPAQLRSHEPLTDPAGRGAVRFTVVTRWSAP